MRLAAAIVLALTTGSPALADPPDRPKSAAAQGTEGQNGKFTIGSPARGEGKSASCSSCHGPNGDSRNPEVPRLAGQSAVYIAGRLTLFRSGAVSHPAMTPLAANLTDQDIDDLAAYYGAQTPAAAAANPAASTSDERAIEQQLRAQGYKLRMVNGEKIYCRPEAPLGSRLVTALKCTTVADAELMEKEGRETTAGLQRRMPGCLTPAGGGCGH